MTKAIKKRVRPDGTIFFEPVPSSATDHINEAPRRVKSRVFGDVVIHRDELTELEAWECWHLDGTAGAFANYGEAGHARSNLDGIMRAATPGENIGLPRRKARAAILDAAKAVNTVRRAEADVDGYRERIPEARRRYDEAKAAEARKMFGPRDEGILEV